VSYKLPRVARAAVLRRAMVGYARNDETAKLLRTACPAVEWSVLIEAVERAYDCHVARDGYAAQHILDDLLDADDAAAAASEGTQ
jgi:hypothetical protein